MEINGNFIFQVDSNIVNEVYASNNNYLIEYDQTALDKYCILYFSSHNIYFPNDEKEFRKNIIRKDKYEWFGNRVIGATKHIFLRDIKKQWYLSGINSNINSPSKLNEFLRNETRGYKVIALGSSAGGFASVIFGQLLNAERIYSFNGQFEILSLLKSSREEINPLVFRNRMDETLLPWYNSRNFIVKPESIFYFYSCKSSWDIEENDYVKDIPLNRIGFKTAHHGIPFLKSNLPIVLNSSFEKLYQFKNHIIHPFLFSIKIGGIVNTIEGLVVIFRAGINKIFRKWR